LPRNLELLLPQLEGEAARCQLLIIDNACDEPIETTFRQWHHEPAPNTSHAQAQPQESELLC